MNILYLCIPYRHKLKSPLLVLSLKLYSTVTLYCSLTYVTMGTNLSHPLILDIRGRHKLEQDVMRGAFFSQMHIPSSACPAHEQDSPRPMQHDKTAARSARMCKPCGSIILGLNDTNRTCSAPDKMGSYCRL
jgi:hypothetical protein